MRRLVDRSTRKPGALRERPAHGHHKPEAEKKRLFKVARCAVYWTGLLNPTADFQRWAETIPRTAQAQANGSF